MLVDSSRLATLALLASVTLLSRLPFLTPRLAHWDAVNYALGLHDFNVAAHQPHPPGSPYYVLLGRAVFTLTGDDNAALIVVSLASSIAAVLGEYVLARLLFGPRAGVLAAVLLLTQPIFWGYGSMGTPWTLLAALALAIGVVCLLLVRRTRELVVPSALLMAVASGFRLDATIFLGPLWVWSVWRAEPEWRRRLSAVALVAVGIVIWLVPVTASSGGLEGWSGRMLALFVPADTASGPLVRQFASNTFISFGTLAVVVGPAVLVSLIANRRTAIHWLRITFRAESGVFWALWIAPAFVFLWLDDSTEPGHDLLFTVGLCALAAGLVVASTRAPSRLLVCGALLAAAQVGVFLYAAPRTDKPPPWAGNSMLLNVTAAGLAQQQASLADSLQVIRSRFEPRDSVVLTVNGQDTYRYMMYYLPEYLVLDLDLAQQSVLAARGQHQGSWQPSPEVDCLLTGADVPDGVRHALWVVWARSEPGIVPADATLVSSSGEAPIQVWEVPPGPCLSQAP